MKRKFAAFKKYLNYFVLPLIFIGAILLLTGTKAVDAQSTCSVVPGTAVTNNQLQLNVQCPNAPFYKVSESPDFKETASSGISIDVSNISTDKSSADISVSYPGGTTGQGSPYNIGATTKSPKVLVVLFDFGDEASGGDLGKPAYATPAWASKLIFGSDYDGRGFYNGVKAFLNQISYGKILLTGEVYPSWVYIPPIQTFRDFNLPQNSQTSIGYAIIDTMIKQNPRFFYDASGNLINDFDYLIALSPGGIANGSTGTYASIQNLQGHPIFEGGWIQDIYYDGNTKLQYQITNEPQISYNKQIVITKYNPSEVTGVWLADDPNHLGTNYFNGGRTVFPYDTGLKVANIAVKYLELGTPLPADNTQVIVTYKPVNILQLKTNLVNAVPADTMPEQTGWYEFFLHELLHGISGNPNFGSKPIGDIYQAPFEAVRRYSIMSSDHNYYFATNFKNSGSSVNYANPSHLDGFTKMQLGLETPYTLNFGQSEKLRLYKTEEGDFTNSSSRTKLIKVPLQPQGQKGNLQLVNPGGSNIYYFGEEYLLLEWRSKSQTVEGAYNFDWNIPSEGLLVYHVLETAPSYNGDHSKTTVRIIDATPITGSSSLTQYMNDEYNSINDTPAAFGPTSGVYHLLVSDFWNWKNTDASTFNFQLSQGQGEKTIYIKFMDLNGNVVATASTAVAGSGVTPTVTSTPTLILGDANLDGLVNEADYDIWFAHYLQQINGGAGVGDFNMDGTINGIDYVVWLNNFDM